MNEAYLKVKVRAGAKEDRLVIKAKDSFEVHVRAEAEQGQANAAVLALLAKHLGIPAGRLHIVKGAHQPSKIISYRR